MEWKVDAVDAVDFGALEKGEVDRKRRTFFRCRRDEQESSRRGSSGTGARGGGEGEI